jgi:eukaryotic-like serine/threonine-protein kinase
MAGNSDDRGRATDGRPTPPDPTVAPPPSTGSSEPTALAAMVSAPATGGMIGSTIGPYRIVAELGAGGMGAVYLAEQHLPVRRQVALKVIHSELQSGDFVRRFESERELLARMNHPNIAQVLDVGSTVSGRLYFAMEYVPGVPLSDFCDHRGLDLRSRLDLFLQACEGVQHAHQKGVIHRDLKPSNLMVADYQGQWLVKVIDFGIAKGIDEFGRLEPGTTRVGTPIGTPAYMSPEQARGDASGIDTRTDVYGLGGVLYKLLTDETPLPHEVISRSTELDFAQLLEQSFVEPPSRRVQRLSKVADSEWKRRMSGDYASQCRRLRGDLDWITLKALEHDRARRYASVSELAADIRRHLGGEPVLASPPGRAYRVGKFVRRHRAAVGAAVAVGLAMVVGTIGTSWMAIEASQQRERAEQALQRAEAERDRAELERRRALSVGSFLEQMIAAPDPWRLQGARVEAREVRVLDVLDDAVAAFERGLAEDPALQAEVGALLGRSLRRLGQYATASRVLDAAEAAAISALPAGATVREALAAELALLQFARGDHQRAAERFDTIFDRHGEAFTMDAELADELRRVAGELALARGEPELAEQRGRAALAAAQARDADDSTAVSGARASLAWILGARGQWEEAEALAQAAHQAERRRLGPTHPVTLRLLTGIASLALRKGDYAAAQRGYREASVTAATVLGDEHPMTLESRTLHAASLDNGGQHAEAVDAFRETLPGYSRALGEDHPDVLTARTNLAVALRNLERFDEAESELDDVLQRRRRVLGATHPETVRNLSFLAVLARDRGDLERAELLLGQTAEVYADINGADHPETLAMRSNHLAIVRDRGDLDRAIAGYAELHRRAESALPPEHWHRAVIGMQYGVALYRAQRYDEASPLVLDAYRSVVGQFAADDPRVAWARTRAEEFLSLAGRTSNELEQAGATLPSRH